MAIMTRLANPVQRPTLALVAACLNRIGTGQTTASESLGNTDWVKLWSDAPTRIYAAGWGQALGLVADRLHDQAAYLKQFSQCSDPAAALKLNAEFAQQSVSRLWNDGTKMFEGIRSITSAAPTK